MKQTKEDAMRQTKYEYICRMKKLLLYLVLCVITQQAMAAKPIAEGIIYNLYWKITSDKTLIIKGKGTIPDFERQYRDGVLIYDVPW